MPVMAVDLGGSPRVSSGSRMAREPRQTGETTLSFLFWETQLMTHMLVVSEPVPAVVGTNTMGSPGRRPLGTPKYCRMGGGLLISTLTPLAVSMEEPPPMATMTSQPAVRAISAACSTISSGGSGTTSSKQTVSMLDMCRFSTMGGAMPKSSIPLS